MASIQRSVIYDDQGRPVGVVLPYEEWASQSKQGDTFKVSEIGGKLDWQVDPIEFQRQVRDECA